MKSKDFKGFSLGERTLCKHEEVGKQRELDPLCLGWAMDGQGMVTHVLIFSKGPS